VLPTAFWWLAVLVALRKTKEGGTFGTRERGNEGVLR